MAIELQAAVSHTGYGLGSPGEEMPDQLDDFRLLGHSGLRVSPLTLGTMTFGVGQGWGSEEGEAEQIFNHYVERGGNCVDTANFYGSGGSERVLAKLIHGRRDGLVISTKYTGDCMRDPRPSLERGCSAGGARDLWGGVALPLLKPHGQALQAAKNDHAATQIELVGR